MSGETLFRYVFLLKQQKTPAPPGVSSRSKQALLTRRSSSLSTRRWLGPLAIAVPPRLAVVTFVEALAVVVTVAISHENGGAMEEREVEGGDVLGMFLGCVFFGELMVDERFGWSFSIKTSWQTSCKVDVCSSTYMPSTSHIPS